MSNYYSNISELLRQGRALQQAEHKSKESEKIGTLRAGSSGIRSAGEGHIAGACHRKGLLRSLGIDADPPDDSKQMMFELGYASEDIVVDTLGRVLEPGHVILREADIPISWITKNGTKVTGRPDLVICRADSQESGQTKQLTPVLGIELKSVHSAWSARKYLFGQTPSLSNLAQAAHYMWKLEVPYKLIYKSYSALGQGMSWAPKMAAMFPKQGDPMSEYMNYNDQGNPLEVKQFEIGYSLEFDSHGRLKFRSDLADSISDGQKGRSDGWVHSLITKQDIQEYYEYVSTMQEKKELGPRPMTLDAIGEKESYTMCKYCPLQETCTKYEAKGFDAWLAAVRKVTGGSK